MKTDITIILDRSGSMNSVRQDTIGGFNSFLRNQREIPGEATISLIQFDDQYETHYINKPIREVADLNEQSFSPRGMTALLDAVGRTLKYKLDAVNAEKAKVNENPFNKNPFAPVPETKYVFVVITDGHENQSTQYSLEQVKSMITDVQGRGWQMVFIGANQDAWGASRNLGFAAHNVMSAAANAVGTKAVYDSLSRSVGSYRTGATGQMMFNAEDKQAQIDAGAVDDGTKDAVPDASIVRNATTNKVDVKQGNETVGSQG